MTASLLLLELTTAKGAAPKGDCTIPGFLEHIAVESFSWNVKTSTTEKAKDSPNVATQPSELQLNKHFDSASSALCKMMETNTPFSKATLRFIDPSTGSGQGSTGKFDSVLEIELSDGFVEKISVSASDNGKSVAVTESISLSFRSAVTLSYRTYDAASKSRNKPITSRIDLF